MKERISYRGKIIKRSLTRTFVNVERLEYEDPFDLMSPVYPVSYHTTRVIIDGWLRQIERRLGTKIWSVV